MFQVFIFPAKTQKNAPQSRPKVLWIPSILALTIIACSINFRYIMFHFCRLSLTLFTFYFAGLSQHRFLPESNSPTTTSAAVLFAAAIHVVAVVVVLGRIRLQPEQRRRRLRQ